MGLLSAGKISSSSSSCISFSLHKMVFMAKCHTVRSLKLQHITVNSILIEQAPKARKNYTGTIKGRLVLIRHLQPCPHSPPTPLSGQCIPYIRGGPVPRSSRPVRKKPFRQLSAHPRRLQYTGESAARVSYRHNAGYAGEHFAYHRKPANRNIRSKWQLENVPIDKMAKVKCLYR